MDTTYFWRKYGYMVFRLWDWKRWKNILRYKVDFETNEMYRKWIREIQAMWIRITGIVCDWRRWLLWWFGDIPTQMCIQHQKQIMIRYITKKPKLEPSRELLEIVRMLWKLKKATISERLLDWHRRNKRWLNERNESGWYMHRRVRSAYHSLRRNMEYVHMYERYKYLPKTTNSLEWKYKMIHYIVTHLASCERNRSGIDYVHSKYISEIWN